jgi:unsaturated rhamnogalacturonyl hydrolase
MPGRAANEPTNIQTREGGPCIFVDNMHSDDHFFSRLYQATNDCRYRRLALTNIQSSIRLLFDEEYHLFHHFWSERLRARNGVLWGRGQGWAMLGIVETLENLSTEDPEAEKLLQIFREHSAALVQYQDSTGHWHTVITDRDSYLEPSIAAFVVDGFSRGLRRRWLAPSHRPVVDRAFAALSRNVGRDGQLEGVSCETYPSLHAEHYKTMPEGRWFRGDKARCFRRLPLTLL